MPCRQLFLPLLIRLSEQLPSWVGANECVDGLCFSFVAVDTAVTSTLCTSGVDLWSGRCPYRRLSVFLWQHCGIFTHWARMHGILGVILEKTFWLWWRELSMLEEHVCVCVCPTVAAYIWTTSWHINHIRSSNMHMHKGLTQSVLDKFPFCGFQFSSRTFLDFYWGI